MCHVQTTLRQHGIQLHLSLEAIIGVWGYQQEEEYLHKGSSLNPDHFEKPVSIVDNAFYY